MLVCSSFFADLVGFKLKMTLEQHWFELCGSQFKEENTMETNKQTENKNQFEFFELQQDEQFK